MVHDLLVDLVNLALTLAGLGLTAWQAWRARSAAEAARDAAMAVRAAQRSQVLLRTMPVLQVAESDLKHAAAESNVLLARRALERWREATPELQAHLLHRDGTREVRTQLTRCAALVREAENALLDGEAVGRACSALLAKAQPLLSALATERTRLENDGGTAP